MNTNTNNTPLHPSSLLPTSGLDVFVLSPRLSLCRPFGQAMLKVKNAFVDVNRDMRSEADVRRPAFEGENEGERQRDREMRSKARLTRG